MGHVRDKLDHPLGRSAIENLRGAGYRLAAGVVSRSRILFARVRDLSGTVRVRTTAAAVIVVGATLLVSAVAMVTLLRGSLTADVRSAALLRAQAVGDELASEPPDERIPVGAPEDEFVQVIDADGEVVASSTNLAEEPAITKVAPGRVAHIERVPFEDGPFLVVATSVATPRGELRVIAGRTLETVEESSEAVGSLLAAGIPLLLVVVGAVTWRVVGRALAPVESMRAEVEAISSRELHRRVPHAPGKDEIARLATTMNGMLNRLEDGQARQRRFISDASHELRSPIATIRQHVDVALSHPNGTSAEELAEIVLEEDVRLQDLVEDLLLLTRMDEGTLGLHAETVDVDDLLFEEAERLRGGTNLRIDTSRVSAGRVSGDRRQLSKLIRNLIDNAIRHAKSTVALSLREDGREVMLTVDDDGEGVPLSERGRIFERFVRLEEARDRDSGGSGLGLAIVSEIAAAHSATVRVVDSPGGGARLEVRFPSTAE